MLHCVSSAGSHPLHQYTTDPPIKGQNLPDRRAWGIWEAGCTHLPRCSSTHTHSTARHSVPPSVSPSPRESVLLECCSLICKQQLGAGVSSDGRRHDEGGCAKRAKQRDPTRPPRAKPWMCCACPSQPEAWRWRRNLLTKARLTSTQALTTAVCLATGCLLGPMPTLSWIWISGLRPRILLGSRPNLTPLGCVFFAFPVQAPSREGK